MAIGTKSQKLLQDIVREKTRDQSYPAVLTKYHDAAFIKNHEFDTVSTKGAMTCYGKSMVPRFSQA